MSIARSFPLFAVWALTACGSTSKTAAPPAPAPPAAEGDCAAQVEDSQPGNHDRFAFTEGDEEVYGYKDGKGTVVIAPRFGYAYEFGSGGVAAAVERPTTPDGSARFVFIDASGKELAVAYAFDNGPDYFQEGVARIVADGKVGFLDRTGVIVIAPQFAGASGFCHGQATVHDGRETWEIDRAGKAVTARRPYVDGGDPCAGL